MAGKSEGCVTPTKGPIVAEANISKEAPQVKQEVKMPLARVGKTAPDFELSGFLNGGFKNFRLSDLKGKWIVICFYPGDFTFV